ncbi:glutamate-1-semialdehyde-2,1-aminomutase [mine drainage metagenome]|uniref:Glutamate-1-semialdehyde-2,1-aminomutase n=1 Tax=mine drainage metagenome TaxID=410659 RepID=T1CBN4_9ZZZZ
MLVGGANSPVRSFRAAGGSPVFFAGGDGAYLLDVDGRRYLDLVSSWGANLLGNAPSGVVAAVRRAAVRDLTFGARDLLRVEGALRATLRAARKEMRR